MLKNPTGPQNDGVNRKFVRISQADERFMRQNLSQLTCGLGYVGESVMLGNRIAARFEAPFIPSLKHSAF
jgi:hypothetical protein